MRQKLRAKWAPNLIRWFYMEITPLVTPHIIPRLASPKWVPIERPSLCESNRAFSVELGVQQSRSGIPASEPVFVADGAGLRGIKRTA